MAYDESLANRQLLYWTLALMILPALSYAVFRLNGVTLVVVWIAGAGALGLLTGYSTGVSETSGTTTEFLKLIGPGVVIPVLAGIATVVNQPKTTTETFVYVGSQVSSKTTAVTLSSEFAHLHPLALFASFFLFYSTLAVAGILLGVSDREEGHGTSYAPPSDDDRLA
jgi:hypothetical protein